MTPIFALIRRQESASEASEVQLNALGSSRTFRLSRYVADLGQQSWLATAQPNNAQTS